MAVNHELLALLTASGLVLLALVRLAGGVVALFFGAKLRWLWVALAAYNFVSKALRVVLYREPDLTRVAVSFVAGVLAAGAAILLSRHFSKAILVIGGFLAGGMILVQAFGPLLTHAPEWLVLGIMAAAGILGVRLALRYTEVTEVVLSALVGAGIVAATLTELMHIDENGRFQVYVLLALIGVGFQLWRTRRAAAGANLNPHIGA